MKIRAFLRAMGKGTALLVGPLLLATACHRKPALQTGATTPSDQIAAGSGSGQVPVVDTGPSPDASRWGSDFPNYGSDERSVDSLEPLLVVTPSPDASSEVELAAGVTPIAVAASNVRADALVLVKNPDGTAGVVRWSAGSGSPVSVATLPAGFDPKSITYHPQRATIFVAGRLGTKSQIISISQHGSAWNSSVIYEGPAEINRLVVGPRPFSGADHEQFRIFFAAKAADGGTSLRTVTEQGRIEYQVAGPARSVVQVPDEDFQPENLPVHYAVPSALHPRGETLLWQDERGCTHMVRYDFQETWHGDRVLRGVPCGSVVRIPPNGKGYLAWTSGRPGVALLDDSAVANSSLALADTFLTNPVPTADGRGLLGVVARAGGRAAIVYTTVALPLGDVANAWSYSFDRCDVELLARNGGFFREADTSSFSPPQIYDLYDAINYGGGVESPKLVTTDLFWETFGAAYNGAFIVEERRRAIPAFHAFVQAADSVLSRSMPTTKWAKVFAALAAVERGETTGEAGRITEAGGPALSSVTGDQLDFGDLKPRGHYTSTTTMGQYFKEVHYLTEVSRADTAPDIVALTSLPREVHQKALAWIDSYRSFIAPARAPLLWDENTARTMAPYAKHPWDHPAAFPLSWGIDNEVLESTVYHEDWPSDEQIDGPGGVRRLHPSGVDIAAMFSSAFGRSLLGHDFVTYPRLRPVLDGISARRPARTSGSGLYQRWLDALAVEWADSSSFPGAPAGSPLWSVKRLQTGLASWATLREATILVNERAGAAEAGEGGFEELVPEIPRGYVEPAPRTFEAIAGLYDALAEDLAIPGDTALQTGVVARLKRSAAEVRGFASMARKELRGEALSDSEYSAIRGIGGTVEHEFLLYKALGDQELAIAIPEPMSKVADVAGDPKLGILEVAVGNPLRWHQIVPYFGRREIALGSVYSYYEFTSNTPYDNARWRAEIAIHPHPDWVSTQIAPAPNACRAPAAH